MRVTTIDRRTGSTRTAFIPYGVSKRLSEKNDTPGPEVKDRVGYLDPQKTATQLTVGLLEKIKAWIAMGHFDRLTI